MTVSIVIPALNEAESLGYVLAEIPAGLAAEVLVVDGGSQDGTADVARAAGAQVIVEAQRGYGRACARGLQAAQGEVVAFMDGDGADDPAGLPDLLAAIAAGADLALGSRLAGGLPRGAMLWHQKLGNQIAAGMIRALYGLPLTDLSPFRAVRRARLLGLGMQEMTYGWPTEMIVKAARQGWRIVELPVGYRPRLAGRSKISGTLRGTTLATYSILTTIVRYSRSGPARG